MQFGSGALTSGLTMSSDAKPNLPENEASAREEITIGARVSLEDLKLIDLARIHAGYTNRAEFIAAAVLEKARGVMSDFSAKAS